jgi:hypothetical protein
MGFFSSNAGIPEWTRDVTDVTNEAVLERAMGLAGSEFAGVELAHRSLPSSERMIHHCFAPRNPKLAKRQLWVKSVTHHRHN